MKIAIAGYGAEGRSNYDYFSKLGHDMTIVDEKSDIENLPTDVPTILGDGVFNRLDDFDMVVRTAGLAPHKITTNGKIWSSTNEFFARCPAQIIGVTGTKGKGTTSSLIAAILESAGKTVHLVGNIGVPALEVLPHIQPSDIVVFELSSFQLWDIERSPHVAVVLMIEPDHLNVHADFDDYVEAKGNISRYQTSGDVCVYNPTNPYSRQAATCGDTNLGISVHRFGVPDDNEVYIESNKFFVQDTIICDIDALRLPGRHNQDNACAAISAVLRFTKDYAAIERGLRNFEGLPHRLELVGDVDGVRYYNDSFSSAPGAAVAAVKSFEAPEILILGGIDKGADFTELAEIIRDRSNIKQVIIIGEIRHKLAEQLQSHGVDKPIDVNDAMTMSQIVESAKRYARRGDIIILSPACASFDMFQNFYDRGDQFREVVRGL